MRAILLTLLCVVCLCSGFVLAMPHDNPKPGEQTEVSKAESAAPCQACQEDAANKSAQAADVKAADGQKPVRAPVCRIYHTMTMGNGVCMWYMLPYNACVGPTGEMSTCDLPFGPCNGDPHHCTSTYENTADATDGLGQQGAPQHEGRVKPSHGPDTKLIPGRKDVVVRLRHNGVLLHLFPMRTEPYKDASGGKYDRLDFFVGRQIVNEEFEDEVEESAVKTVDGHAKFLDVDYQGVTYRVVLHR